jgi:hypothetical protein
MKHTLLILLLALGGVAFAQPAFDETGNKFKDAVAKDDFNAIADMLNYPFISFDWGSYAGTVEMESREVFLKAAKDIFSKSVKQTIAKNKFKKIEDEGDGSVYYTIVFYKSNESASWIIFNLIDGEWKATSTENVSQ